MYSNKCKGVPKRADKVYDTNEDQVYVYKKPNKLRESIRRDLIPNKWDYVEKIVSKKEDKREWENDKKSIPIKLNMSMF
jgi:hypothetical protein